MAEPRRLALFSRLQVGRLLDVKREDIKAKRAAEAASGVAARRGRAAEAKRKRRRSQVAKALVLKRADEILEESGKAEEIRQRRGSLGTLRPEDVRFKESKRVATNLTSSSGPVLRSRRTRRQHGGNENAIDWLVFAGVCGCIFSRPGVRRETTRSMQCWLVRRRSEPVLDVRTPLNAHWLPGKSCCSPSGFEATQSPTGLSCSHRFAAFAFVSSTVRRAYIQKGGGDRHLRQL